MSITAVDVDGTLRNPVILGGVMLYGLLLAAAICLGLREISRGGQRTLVGFVILGVGLIAAVANVAGVRALASLFIRTMAPGGTHMGVGFFWSHPPWLAPAIGAAVGPLAFLFYRRIQHPRA